MSIVKRRLAIAFLVVFFAVIVGSFAHESVHWVFSAYPSQICVLGFWPHYGYIGWTTAVQPYRDEVLPFTVQIIVIALVTVGLIRWLDLDNLTIAPHQKRLLDIDESLVDDEAKFL